MNLVDQRDVAEDDFDFGVVQQHFVLGNVLQFLFEHLRENENQFNENQLTGRESCESYVHYNVQDVYVICLRLHQFEEHLMSRCETLLRRVRDRGIDSFQTGLIWTSGVIEIRPGGNVVDG